jgi:hypothetical protein
LEGAGQSLIQFSSYVNTLNLKLFITVIPKNGKQTNFTFHTMWPKKDANGYHSLCQITSSSNAKRMMYHSIWNPLMFCVDIASAENAYAFNTHESKCTADYISLPKLNNLILIFCLIVSNVKVAQLIDITILIGSNYTQPIPHIMLLQILFRQVLQIPAKSHTNFDLRDV